MCVYVSNKTQKHTGRNKEKKFLPTTNNKKNFLQHWEIKIKNEG